MSNSFEPAPLLFISFGLLFFVVGKHVVRQIQQKLHQQHQLQHEASDVLSP